MSRPRVQCISTLPTAHERTPDEGGSGRGEGAPPAAERSGQAREASTGSTGKPGSSSAI